MAHIRKPCDKTKKVTCHSINNKKTHTINVCFIVALTDNRDYPSLSGPL